VEPNTTIVYKELFEQIENPLMYSSPWWLDAVCGLEGWESAILRDQQNQVVAALPYHITRIRGLSAVITPPLTQWVSLLQNSKQETIMESSMLLKLPSSSILDLCLRPGSARSIQDERHPVQQKYSFIIPAGENDFRAGYNEGLKRNLREAENNYTLSEPDDLSTLLALCDSTYQQRKMKPPGWFNRVVTNVYGELRNRQCGKMMLASHHGEIIAGILTGWDHASTYYLAGGRTGNEQGASAHALLLDHAIHEARLGQRAFDFEGSMEPGIANFFQSFGARPVPYWRVRKFTGMGKLWSLFH
jgi:hypothetical protein